MWHLTPPDLLLILTLTAMPVPLVLPFTRTVTQILTTIITNQSYNHGQRKSLTGSNDFGTTIKAAFVSSALSLKLQSKYYLITSSATTGLATGQPLVDLLR